MCSQCGSSSSWARCLFTGDVRGAGSPSPAVIQLIGSDGVSDLIPVGEDPDSPGIPAPASYPEGTQPALKPHLLSHPIDRQQQQLQSLSSVWQDEFVGGVR